jgi:predicted Zn-dependent protease
MKSIRISVLVIAAALISMVPPAQAQLGGILKGVKDAQNKIDKAKNDWDLTEEQEVRLGEQISAKVRAKFGVVQDPAIHKYVALVGTTLAKNSSRSKLAWHFIVLDTPGVNAFAAPGGYVHITRGALAMLKDESELAGVLGHELTHVTNKHTIKALQKNKAIQLAEKKADVGSDPAFMQKLADEGENLLLVAGFDRPQELEADSEGLALAAKSGYDPAGLRKFLGALNDRNKDSQAKQGLFASHPDMNERIQKLDAAIASDKSGAKAVLADRFTMHVTYKPVELDQIAVVADGTKGLTDDNGKKDDKKDDKKTDEKKPSRFSQLKNAAAGGNESKQSASVTGSGGPRGVDRELSAQGGSNPAPVAVTVTDAELADFIRQGNLRS